MWAEVALAGAGIALAGFGLVAALGSNRVVETYAEPIRNAVRAEGLELVEVVPVGGFAGLFGARTGWLQADGHPAAYTEPDADILRIARLRDRWGALQEVRVRVTLRHGAILALAFDRPLRGLDVR